jgi:hypothetical protein
MNATLAWNFQVLAVPEIGNSAAKAAAQADFVILSMHRKAQLSVQTRDGSRGVPLLAGGSKAHDLFGIKAIFGIP